MNKSKTGFDRQMHHNGCILRPSQRQKALDKFAVMEACAFCLGKHTAPSLNHQVGYFFLHHSLTNLTLTQQLIPHSCRIQDVPNYPHIVALTTSPATPESELDDFEFGDDSTTLTSVEQSTAIEVVLWNYHQQRIVSGFFFVCFVSVSFLSRLKGS